MTGLPPLFHAALSAFLVVSLCIPSFGSEREEAMTIALHLQKAIENADLSVFIKLTHKGVCFTDDCYKKSEVISLLKNKSSWFYKL